MKISLGTWIVLACVAVYFVAIGVGIARGAEPSRSWTLVLSRGESITTVPGFSAEGCTAAAKTARDQIGLSVACVEVR